MRKRTIKKKKGGLCQTTTREATYGRGLCGASNVTVKAGFIPPNDSSCQTSIIFYIYFIYKKKKIKSPLTQLKDNIKT
jgi:hypothetical protein